jgi:hypothetical protein
LLMDPPEFYDRSALHFNNFVRAPGRLGGFVPSRTFYASMILSEPLVLERLHSF